MFGDFKFNGTELLKSGRTTNGYFEKLADGTIKQSGVVNVGTSGSVLVTMPKACIDSDYWIVGITPRYKPANGVTIQSSVDKTSASTFTIYLRDYRGAALSVDTDVYWAVIGKWR